MADQNRNELKIPLKALENRLEEFLENQPSDFLQKQALLLHLY